LKSFITNLSNLWSLVGWTTRPLHLVVGDISMIFFQTINLRFNWSLIGRTTRAILVNSNLGHILNKPSKLKSRQCPRRLNLTLSAFTFWKFFSKNWSNFLYFSQCIFEDAKFRAWHFASYYTYQKEILNFREFMIDCIYRLVNGG